MNDNKYNNSSKTYKKGALFISMMGDSAVDVNNKKYIPNADKTFGRIKKGLASGTVKEKTIVFVGPGDSHFKWESCQGWDDYKIAKIVTASDDWISVDSKIVIKDITDGSDKELNCDQLDFIFSPSEYYIAHAGIDWFGAMQNAMSKLSALGYSQSCYVDASHLYGKSPVSNLKKERIRPLSTTFERKVKE